MLASQFSFSNLPLVNFTDRVSFALRLMEDYDLHHLPVMQEGKFAGLIDKDDLLDEEEKTIIGSIEYQIKKVFVKSDDHFLTALKLAVDFGVSIIPVINNEWELLGTISRQDLLRAVSVFYSMEEPGGLIVLEMEKRNYAFGELSRLVETNDAVITQLNTSTEAATGLFIVTIKLNKLEISDIVATFQRYDYTIRTYFGEELYENELKENYDLLMTYLRM